MQFQNDKLTNMIARVWQSFRSNEMKQEMADSYFREMNNVRPSDREISEFGNYWINQKREFFKIADFKRWFYVRRAQEKAEDAQNPGNKQVCQYCQGTLGFTIQNLNTGGQYLMACRCQKTNSERIKAIRGRYENIEQLTEILLPHGFEAIRVGF